MSKSTVIIDVYNSCKIPTRDIEVAKKINAFFKNNIQAVSDGIINTTLKISGSVRDDIASCYRLSSSHWDKIKKSPEYSKFANSASVLKLGLLISYIETGSRVFLVFLFMLDFSARMPKYFKRDYDRAIMRYTLENSADDRTDFKRYGMSLITVVNKKVDTYIAKFGKELSMKNIDDKTLRLLLQSILTRMNAMVKAISQKYYKNFYDKDVKIMIQYSKTADGKQVLSPVNVIESVRERAIDNLAYPSDSILKMAGFVTSGNLEISTQRGMIIKFWRDIQSNLVKVSNMILDDWIKRVGSRISIKAFRTEFLRTMSIARNVAYIMNEIDATVNILISKANPTIRIERIEFRKKIYLYLLANMYMQSKDLIN